MGSSIQKKFLLIQLFVLGYVSANVVYPLLTQRILDRLSAGKFSSLKGLFILLFAALTLLVACSRGRALSKKSYLNQVKQFYREKVLDCVYYENNEKCTAKGRYDLFNLYAAVRRNLYGCCHRNCSAYFPG